MGRITERIEAVDIALAKALAPLGHSSVGGAICQVGKLADQPPMRIGFALTAVAGLARGDGTLVRTGLRMAAAHTLATIAKNAIKKRIDRTRPELLIDEGEYRAEPGDSEAHDVTSFPSGHTAGAVAAALAVGREYPAQRGASLGVAAVLAAMQLPKQAHYLSDIAAGALIGWASETLVAALWPVGGDGRAQ